MFFHVVILPVEQLLSSSAAIILIYTSISTLHQMRLMFDGNKRLVMVSDAWGKGYPSENLQVRCANIRLSVVHPDPKYRLSGSD